MVGIPTDHDAQQTHTRWAADASLWGDGDVMMEELRKLMERALDPSVPDDEIAIPPSDDSQGFTDEEWLALDRSAWHDE